MYNPIIQGFLYDGYRLTEEGGSNKSTEIFIPSKRLLISKDYSSSGYPFYSAGRYDEPTTPKKVQIAMTEYLSNLKKANPPVNYDAQAYKSLEQELKKKELKDIELPYEIVNSINMLVDKKKSAPEERYEINKKIEELAPNVFYNAMASL